MASSVRVSPAQVDLLNFARASAAQLVLVGHTMHQYLDIQLDRNGRLETFGVLIFFVLSGFLICSSVLQRWDGADYRLEHFIVDRFCRIFVAYVPALVFVAAADTAMRAHSDFPYGAEDSLGTWLGNLVMLQEYPAFQILRRLGVPEQSWFVQPFGSGRPFWTVAIEWWIYLSFGYLTLRFLRAKRFTVRGLLALALLGVVPAYNAMGGVGDCLTLIWIVGALFAVLQSWLAGRAGERAPEERRQEFRLLCLAGTALCAALLLGRIVAVGFRVYDLQFAMFVAGFLFGCFFLVGSFDMRLPQPLRRAVDFAANYSYSLYLTHFTVLIAFTLYLPSVTHYDPHLFLAVLATANIGGVVFWYVFERHYRAAARVIKDALDRHRPRTAPVPALRLSDGTQETG